MSIYYIWAIDEKNNETPAGVWSAELRAICREFGTNRYMKHRFGNGTPITGIRYEKREKLSNDSQVLESGTLTGFDFRSMYLDRLKTLRMRR